ncbi:MAG: hypothetical protein J1E65_01255 [Lachnospiraceae bacterium]|nr:hypothetical protein [Lachnospiraceae bacterium]
MKKRIMALMLAAVMVFSLTACGSSRMSAAVRGPETISNLVYIDEEAVALVGSLASAEMTEAEIARAAELRGMAVEAFNLVNAYRIAYGLPELVWDDQLEACAQVRANELATLFSHTRPNGSDWYTVNSDLMWGENLAKGYTNASKLVEGWMNSPTHAANILDTEYTTCSIAVYEVGNKLYFAQEFGY